MPDSALIPPADATLPPIPVIAIGAGGAPALARAAEARMLDLYGCARRLYTPPVLALGDAVSRRWLERSANPYLDEIRAVAARLPAKGAHLLNLSYEWCCTTGVAPDPGGDGMRMRRVLDWRMAGLGRNLVVARQTGGAGGFLNVTWPGVVGVYTAMAPGRFAAAINQTPLRSRSVATLPFDWLAARRRHWRSTALPPSHLLRRAFETCAAYDEARAMLRDTPICLPAFFVLSGVAAGEGCVIERTEDGAVVHDGPGCVANHWLAMRETGRPRGRRSRDRHAQMQATMTDADAAFGWLTPPVLNRDTRLAVEANAATGRLTVQGWERAGPATQVLRIAR